MNCYLYISIQRFSQESHGCKRLSKPGNLGFQCKIGTTVQASSGDISIAQPDDEIVQLLSGRSQPR
ncbi:hypothetical protein M413DRAFT_143730 [Hebeloma cylindrosporum]|uniref:Uncharacterized protein n=1 Tax=Hebeloma cylindrosporum TaxID=76867 RepID=A0A0C2YM24_HEBCY|nr:hypothetical protein M413DRAFT_143730 [Hebeloma cylindrosporum h7]